jgi:hypothetical protein
MAMVYAGTATREQLEAVFAKIGALTLHETRSVLHSICCNDAAPEELLEKIALRVSALSKKKPSRRRHRFHRTDDLVRNVMAAMFIHPNVSAESREKLAKGLRRRRVNIDLIHRTTYNGRIEVSCEPPGPRRRRRWSRRQMTVKELQKRAGVLERLAARTWKKAATLERKLAEKQKKKAARAARPIKRARRR